MLSVVWHNCSRPNPAAELSTEFIGIKTINCYALSEKFIKIKSCMNVWSRCSLSVLNHTHEHLGLLFLIPENSWILILLLHYWNPNDGNNLQRVGLELSCPALFQNPPALKLEPAFHSPELVCNCTVIFKYTPHFSLLRGQSQNCHHSYCKDHCYYKSQTASGNKWQGWDNILCCTRKNENQTPTLSRATTASWLN